MCYIFLSAETTEKKFFVHTKENYTCNSGGLLLCIWFFCCLGIKKNHPRKFANIFIRSGSFSLWLQIPNGVPCLVRKSRGPTSQCLLWGLGIDRQAFSHIFLLSTRISSLITRIKPSDHDRATLAAGTKLERIPDVIRWIPAPRGNS